MRLKTKIEIYNLILKNQSVQVQSQPPNTAYISQPNHVATSYSQPYTPRFAYPQYDHQNYSTVPYGTPRQLYTQIHQNIVPSFSAVSSVGDISQDSSDLDILG